MQPEKRTEETTQDPLAAFRQKLTELRESAGNPSYANMARRAGCHPSTLNQIISGPSTPTTVAVQLFVRACGVRPEDEAQWELWRQAATGQSQPTASRPRPTSRPQAVTTQADVPAGQPVRAITEGVCTSFMVPPGQAITITPTDHALVITIVPA